LPTTSASSKNFGVSLRSKAKSLSVFKARFACLRAMLIFARVSVLIDDCWTAFAGVAASTDNLFFISFFLMFAVRVSPYAACFTPGADIF
jgi:hypothetical protein